MKIEERETLPAMARAYAHSRENTLPEKWHSLEDHLQGVAKLASQFALTFKAGLWGEAAGLWHDLGKYSKEFQDYIRLANGITAHMEETPVPGRVDHSTFGAQHAFQVYGKDVGKLLAYCIAGHHAGLPDGHGSERSLETRLVRHVPKCPDMPLIIAKHKSPLELPVQLKNQKIAGFQIAFFTRMLFSSLVDADFLDTEAFMDPQRSMLRLKPRPSMSELSSKLTQHLDSMADNAQKSTVNLHRRDVLDSCRKASSQTPGFFSLTVPTGGGKTLSSLAFALSHAHQHNLERVIYAIPFNSIIEQNAEVFKNIFQDFGEGVVLEHHCHIDPEIASPWSRIAAENWDAPLVVTTNVQFFESLFAARPSRCRKLHRLARSVIILDEAQALPIRYMRPCLEALRELVTHYGCSVILCTATQPALIHREDFTIGLEGIREIIPEPSKLFSCMRRVQISHRGTMNDEAMAERLAQENQVLCVVNTRDHAKRLFKTMGDKSEHYHLSTRLCAAHRFEMITEIRGRLKKNKPCRVVSTQLIEAGVDMDFPVAWRALAGLDSIAQAAGRCNREGKLERGQVWIFEPERKKDIPVGDIRQAAETLKSEILGVYDDFLSPEAIEHYFRLHYWKKSSEMDAENIMSCFEAFRELNFDFRKAADKFQLIDDRQISVIVPYGETGKNIVDELYSTHQKRIPPPHQVERRAQRYMVPLYPNEAELLKRDGSLEFLHERFLVLADQSRYHEHFGLQPGEHETPSPETLTV